MAATTGVELLALLAVNDVNTLTCRLLLAAAFLLWLKTDRYDNNTFYVACRLGNFVAETIFNKQPKGTNGIELLK